MVTIPYIWLGEIVNIHYSQGADIKGTIEEVQLGCLGEAPKRQLNAMLKLLKDPKFVDALNRVYDEWDDIVRPVLCEKLREYFSMCPEVKID